MSQFVILSHEVIDTPCDKKHVVYTISLQNNNETPVLLKRRYTDFLTLYKTLRDDYANIVSQVLFPKKVLLGNFTSNVILSRRCRFQDFLNLISNNERLQESNAMVYFLTRNEEVQAIFFLQRGCYALAKPLFLNVFMLVNKVYTEKHPVVVKALCRLVACCNADVTAPQDTEKYVQLAIRRYESVSDVDLLRYYIPLLHLALALWTCLGKDKERSLVEARLESMKRQGHRVDGNPSLFEAIFGDQNVNRTLSFLRH